MKFMVTLEELRNLNWQHLIIKESLKYLKAMKVNMRSEQNDKISHLGF